MIECQICFKRGNEVWAEWHRKTSGHGLGESDEPPSKLQSSQGSHGNNGQSVGFASVAIGTKLRQRFLSGAFCSLRPDKQ